MTEAEHLDRFLSDKSELAAYQSSATGTISIHEAIARTIKYNLDNSLAQMEAAFSLDQLGAAKLQMLPRLALNAGYSIRNSESGSTSISYYTRGETLAPSVSAPVNRVTADISFSWSLLDFGISYFQAKQQANRYLILTERRRRITNNLVKEVIIAYYRLASLERIKPQVAEALAESEKALETYRRMEESKTGSIPEALEQQRAIITIMSQLRQLSNDVAVARSRLGALMNVPNGEDFVILPVSDAGFAPPRLASGLPELENIGVFLRPDLREESYQARIDRDEVKKEMIRMFPGVTALGSGNYDSNHFLVNNFWAEASGKFTQDILGLAGRYRQMKAAKTQTEVGKIRRLAGTVAAMVQIDMSYYQYYQAISQFTDAQELNRIDKKLSDISAASAGARAIGRLKHIMQNVSSVNSRLDLDRRMVDVLVAWANLYFSIGCDMLDCTDMTLPLPVLSESVRQSLERWLSGELPALPDRPEFKGIRITSSTAYGAPVMPASAVPAETEWPAAETVGPYAGSDNNTVVARVKIRLPNPQPAANDGQ